MTSDLDPEALETLRAVAEVFIPGSPEDPTPGAADIAAERFIAHYLEFLLPGLARGVPDLLDGQAAERFGGRRFVTLGLDERGAVLDALSEHEVPQLRELPTLLAMLAVAAVYGEWSGTDEHGRVVGEPLGWRLTAFAGPSRGRPELLRP